MENLEKKKINRYIDATADPVFKALFCDERHSFIPMSFINSILPEDQQISEITHLQTEIQGITPYNKTSRLDLHM